MNLSNMSHGSEAEPYLPKRTTPLNVTIGIEDKVTLDMPTFGQASLRKKKLFLKKKCIQTC